MRKVSHSWQMTLQTRIVESIPENIPFIAAKRAVVDLHNMKMLQSLSSPVVLIEAVDIIGTSNASLKKLTKPTLKARSTLPSQVSICIGARVMG